MPRKNASRRVRNNKRIAIVAGAALILLALIYYLYFVRPVQECYAAANETQKSACLYSLALSRNDASLCKDAATLHDMCVQKIALATGREALCDDARILKDACYSIIAQNRSDVALCKRSALSDACIWRIVIAKSNASLCAEAGAFSQRCYADFAAAKNDASLCAQSNTDLCYSQLARSTKSVSYCERVSAAARDNCVMEVARASKNAALCESAPSIKDLCYSNVNIAIRGG